MNFTDQDQIVRSRLKQVIIEVKQKENYSSILTKNINSLETQFEQKKKHYQLLNQQMIDEYLEKVKSLESDLCEFETKNKTKILNISEKENYLKQKEVELQSIQDQLAVKEVELKNKQEDLQKGIEDLNKELSEFYESRLNVMKQDVAKIREGYQGLQKRKDILRNAEKELASQIITFRNNRKFILAEQKQNE